MMGILPLLIKKTAGHGDWQVKRQRRHIIKKAKDELLLLNMLIFCKS